MFPFLYLHLSLLLLLACTYLNNAWDLVLWALPLYVCLFKINRFMYSLDKSICKMTKCKCKHEQKQGCKKWPIVYFVCQKALFLCLMSFPTCKTFVNLRNTKMFHIFLMKSERMVVRIIKIVNVHQWFNCNLQTYKNTFCMQRKQK